MCLVCLLQSWAFRTQSSTGLQCLTPGAAPVTAAVVVTAASRQCRPASERQRAAPARSTPAPLPRAPAWRRSSASRRAAVALSAGSRALPAFPLAPWPGRARRLALGTFLSFMRLTPSRPPLLTLPFTHSPHPVSPLGRAREPRRPRRPRRLIGCRSTAPYARKKTRTRAQGRRVPLTTRRAGSAYCAGVENEEAAGRLPPFPAPCFLSLLYPNGNPRK